jgi:hypothetical protein
MVPLPLAWRAVMDAVEGKRVRGPNMVVVSNGEKLAMRAVRDKPATGPNPALLAVCLRAFADSGEPVPPEMLRRLASMFDRGKGVTAELKWPKGGKAPKHDRIAIGRRADKLLNRVPRGYSARVVHHVAKRQGCSERIVKEALRDYRRFGHAQPGA